MSKKKITISILCFVTIIVVIGVYFHIRKNYFALDRVSDINLFCKNQEVQVSLSDKNKIKRIFSGGDMGNDGGISCGLNKNAKIALKDKNKKITIVFPYDNCGNLKIEGTGSKYVFISQDQKNELNKIIQKYTETDII